MKAMILAAGRGERLRPLTNHTPKPLLKVGDMSLIEHHINNLKTAGIYDIVINVSYLKEKIIEHLGDGQKYGVTINYSEEPEGALETGGGIVKALPYLGEQEFLVVNGDIFTEHTFSNLPKLGGNLGHLYLVPNPDFKSIGDFGLENSMVTNGDKYTFTGIGIYHPDFFKGKKISRFPLGPLLREVAGKNLLSGELFTGNWTDIGTVERYKRCQVL